MFKIGPFNFQLNRFTSFFIIVLFCFGVYCNSIFNDYSIDDPIVVTGNKYVQKGISGIPEILTHPYQDVYGNFSDYRPISEITLAVEYQFFGMNPHVSHLVNIILYCILCWLIYQLLLCFKLNEPYPYLPLLITGFFIVHSAHTEVVNSIKNREDILSMMFGIGSLLFAFHFYTSDKRKILNLTGVIVCLMLALISKLAAVPFIVIIVLMAYQFGPQIPLKRVVALFALIIIGIFISKLLPVPYFIAYATIPLAALYFDKGKKAEQFNALLIYILIICTFYYLDFHNHSGSRQAIYLENPLTFEHQLLPNVALALDTLWFYFKFMLVPFPFRFYYGTGSIPLHELSDGVLVISFLIHAALFAYGLYTLWRRQLTGFLIISYFIFMAIYCNLYTKYTGIVSERVLFVPSLWFITAMFLLLFNIFKNTSKKKIAADVPGYVWIILAGFFIFYATLTIHRNFQWKNYLILVSSDIDNLENSTLANLQYADLLRDAGEKEKNDTLRKLYLDKAKFYYNRTIKLSPKYAFPYFGLGEIYRYDEGKIDTGCNYFYSAYLFDSTYTATQFQMGRCAYERGLYTEAKRLLGNLYAKGLNDTYLLYYYAKTLYVTGDAKGARQVNEALHKLTPDADYYYINEGYFNNLAGNIPEAANNFEKAINMGCRDRDILNFMLNYYLNTGQNDKANSLQQYFNQPLTSQK